MPANIEQSEDGRQAAFVSAREVPWHRLGTVTEGAMSAAEAAELGHLANWDVRTEPVYVLSTEGPHLAAPRHVATLRTSPFTGEPEILGVVGKGYEIVQNEEAFAVLDNVVDESGAHFETAGSISNGRRVFMSMKLPEGIKVGGEDQTDVYLLATNSHDGSSAFKLAVTPVRVVCQNTLTLALRQARQSWSLRHTSTVQGRIEEARESIKLTFEYADAFEAEMSKLLDQAYTDRQFESLVQRLIPKTESKQQAAQERVTQQRDQMRSLFYDASTQEFGRGTKYGALNAAIEYADWMIPVKGEDPDGTKRATRAFEGSTIGAFKARAYAMVSAPKG